MNVRARVWKEGKRVAEVNAIAVETDGEEIEILSEDGYTTYKEGEWDELTVLYDW